MLYTSKEPLGFCIVNKPSNKNSDTIDVRCTIGNEENVNNENTKVFIENCKEKIAPDSQGKKVIFIFYTLDSTDKKVILIFSYIVTITK